MFTKLKVSLLLTALSVLSITATSQTITPLQSGKPTSLRGLSVVNDQVAWVSGSNGWVARTTDRGKTWDWKQLADYAKLDFRDIEAFSESKAIIVSAGTPGVILLTIDGGATWKEVYKNTAPEIFLDGMDFWDAQHGIIYGDPIQSKMQLLKTEDGGFTWQDISSNLNIPLVEGEASFAASGTGIRTMEKGIVWIATGGNKSRIFFSADYGKKWKAFDCPIIQGKSSTGPYSIAFRDKKNGVAIGGDYTRDTLRTNNMLLTFDGGKTWKQPKINPGGYRSSIEYISKKVVLAGGTSGLDISRDAGNSWIAFSKESFNSIRKAKNGNWVLALGSRGKISSIDGLK